MELQFGGGVSGAIGRATQAEREIEAEAGRKIKEFYQK